MARKSKSKAKKPEAERKHQRDAATPAAAAADRSPKRKRQKSGENALEELEASRPEPPPPPPASLIRLLKRDASVVKYFTSLQENLLFDVRKWKVRARAYESNADSKDLEISKLKEEIETLKANNANRISRLKEPQMQHLFDEGGDNGAVRNEGHENKGVNDNQKEKVNVSKSDADRGVEINDSVFNFESSSDEEDPQHELEIKKPAPLTTEKEDLTQPSKNDEGDDFHLSFSEGESDDGDETPRHLSSDANHTNGSDQQVTPSERQKAGHESDSSQSTRGILGKMAGPKYARPSIRPKLIRASGLRQAGKAPVAKPPVLDDPKSDDDGSSIFSDKTEIEGPVNDEYIKKLAQAKQYLDRLGVSLVISEEPSKEGEIAQDLERQTAESEHQHTVTRRSDSDVASDLYYALKILCRENVFGDKGLKYRPFMGARLIPCYKYVNEQIEGEDDGADGNGSVRHPAVEGFRCALRALRLMDIYCVNWKETKWEEISRSGSHYEYETYSLLVGMKERHRMVQSVLSSLNGEIGEVWSVLNRKNRLSTETIHFESGGQKELGLENNSSDNNFGAKSLTRFAGMVEHCMSADLAISMQLLRNDPQVAASVVWRYFISSLPMLNGGEYPKFPPVLSFCILESMLRPSYQSAFMDEIGEQTPDKHSWLFRLSNLRGGDLALHECMSVAVHAIAVIHRLRLCTENERIRDVSRVELASYARIKDIFLPNDLEGMGLASYVNALENFLSMIQPNENDTTQELVHEVPVMLNVLIADGAAAIDKRLTSQCVEVVREAARHHGAYDAGFRAPLSFLALISTRRRITVNSMELINQCISSPNIHSSSLLLPSASANALVDAAIGNFNSSTPLATVVRFSALALRTCLELSDGESAIRLVLWAVSAIQQDSAPDALSKDVQRLLTQIRVAWETPTVRVITLERRKDRMAAFVAQCLYQRILVARGVTPLNKLNDTDAEPPSFGEFAFDGRGNLNGAEQRLSNLVGSARAMDKLVSKYWCPNDLRPFDRNAPKSEDLVLINPTEKACALSHISAWKGVINALTAFHQEDDPGKGIFRSVLQTARRIEIAGFAFGQAIRVENESMSPVPVCVILEDDAILTDRFRTRLTELLAELPRDFHFCSLGYGRPKTAPMVPYSTHIGIPTSIWYLTGYVLSLEGAKYLVDSLPVRGPVDSWIGLKMFAKNWDNSFGHKMGVGVHAKLRRDLDIPQRKSLRMILNFRAFAALVPLCSQKISSAAPSARGLRSSKVPGWRQRDTDIIYSG